MVEKIIRSSAVPVGHSPHILRMDQVSFAGIVQYLAPQFAPVLKGPEKITVIVRTGL